MQHSETLTALATALAKAQGEIENAAKNAANPHFRSKYADLAEIINTVRPVLSKHGLSVVQIPGFADGVVTVDTMLLHASGEWVQGTAGAPIGKADAQGVGSATTYLRRYSLAALCGIAQEDDDGHGAAQGNGRGGAVTSTPSPRERNATAPTIGASEKQIKFLRNLSGSSVFSDEERERLVAANESGDRERVSKAIEWAQEQIAARKEAVPA